MRRTCLILLFGALGIFIIICVGAYILLHSSTTEDAGPLTTIPDAKFEPYLAVVPHPNVPLKPGVNMLWCLTTQLAWNEMIDQVGEVPTFTTNPSEVSLLNRQDFTKDDLDSHNYILFAGSGPDLSNQIQRALDAKFKGAHLTAPSLSELQADDYVLYSAIHNHFSFYPFQDTGLIKFGRTSVLSFGWDHWALDPLALKQVELTQYTSEDNFVLEITQGWDQVILAKIPPADTLQETIQKALSRTTRLTVDQNSTIKIPKFNFDVTCDFPHLEGLKLKASASAKIQDMVLGVVKQNIRFQMNRFGVKLDSNAFIPEYNSIQDGESPRLVFDKPFLVLLFNRRSKHPYFALWVADPTLLQKP